MNNTIKGLYHHMFKTIINVEGLIYSYIYEIIEINEFLNKYKINE